MAGSPPEPANACPYTKKPLKPVRLYVIAFLAVSQAFLACSEGVRDPDKTEKADFSDNFTGNAQNTRHISLRLHEVFVRASV